MFSQETKRAWENEKKITSSENDWWDLEKRGIPERGEQIGRREWVSDRENLPASHTWCSGLIYRLKVHSCETTGVLGA
jgi:hypothetical protein